MAADDQRLILTLSCPDRVGVVATVTGFVASVKGWIVESASHAESTSNRFFMREEILVSSLDVDVDEFRARFAVVADELQCTWDIALSSTQKKIAVFVSKNEHCLYDLLGRARSGELAGDIKCVLSNHDDLRDVTNWHGIDFHRIESSNDATVLELLMRYETDVVVLARYMQLVPEALCAKYAGRMINIHHSFLPSFKGARPYQQAHDRGVKLVGATCHYVTTELDEGPIIEQDVMRIDHSDSVEQLCSAGKDLEKAVLARGLRWHLENRVLLDGDRTVVFR